MSSRRWAANLVTYRRTGSYAGSAAAISCHPLLLLDVGPWALTGRNEPARAGMLDLLRDAFNHNWTVIIDYSIDPGKTNGVIIRTALTR